LLCRELSIGDDSAKRNHDLGEEKAFVVRCSTIALSSSRY